MFNSFPISIDKNQKTIRPEMYTEVHTWMEEEVPGKNMKDKTLNVVNFYKKYYDTAPIITASEDMIETLKKILK